MKIFLNKGEDMSLLTRLHTSSILTPQEKLMLGVLNKESMTSKQLVDCLMSDPYDLTFEEVFSAMDGLIKKRLIVIARPKADQNNFKIEIYLTFAEDWVFRL